MDMLVEITLNVLVGKTKCYCPIVHNSSIIDIDECANNSSNLCAQQCVNTAGSYKCDCYDGYRPVNDTHCEGKQSTVCSFHLS